MAIVDVEKQDKVFDFGAAKTLKKTTNGFNVLTEDRLKLRKIVIKMLNAHLGTNISEDNTIRAVKSEIERIANNLVWVVPNEYCKDLCKEDGKIYSSDGVASDLEDIVGRFLQCYSKDFILADGSTNDVGLYFEMK